MPADDTARAELELLQAWESELVELFQVIDGETNASVEDSVDSEHVRGYRSRVGQDLKAFQEKLANIMESEKSGQ